MARGPLPVVGKAHEQADAGEPFDWFIYGSSLERGAFAAWCGEHGYWMPELAAAVPVRLTGYRLSFDVQSRFWGGAVASLAEAAGQAVEGVVLPLPGSARGLVNHKEGAISGLYAPFQVSVTPLAGGAPRAAIAYRAAPDRRLPAEAKPAPAFLKTLLAGARDLGLSAGYIERLAKLLAA